MRNAENISTPCSSNWSYRLSIAATKGLVSTGVPNYHRFHDSVTSLSIRPGRVRILLLFTVKSAWAFVIYSGLMWRRTSSNLYNYRTSTWLRNTRYVNSPCNIFVRLYARSFLSQFRSFWFPSKRRSCRKIDGFPNSSEEVSLFPPAISSTRKTYPLISPSWFHLRAVLGYLFTRHRVRRAMHVFHYPESCLIRMSGRDVYNYRRVIPAQVRSG